MGDGYPVTTDFPYTVEYVNLKIKGYAKITSDSIAFYVGLENLPEGMLYKDGVFFCNEDTKAYTLSDNEIQTDDNEACVVDIVGDQCTFTFLDTVDTESLITISMERSDFSEIYEATENCEIYQTFGL